MSDITIYENLANAIILQAVKDYRMALKSLKSKSEEQDGAGGKSRNRAVLPVRSGTRRLQMWMARC